LIVGEDADEDSIPRFSNTFVRVLGALTEKLNAAGFEVFDETEANLGNFFQDRVRRTDADLTELAASVSESPIVLALSLSIFATSDDRDYFTRIRTRVIGRLINVENGHRLGGVEVGGPRPLNAPLNCARDCVLELVNRHSKELSNHVDDLLVGEVVELADEGERGDAGEGRGTRRTANSYYLDDEMTFQARRRFNRHQTASISGGAGTILADRP